MTETEFMGYILELEVAHEIPSSSSKEEEVLLSVTNLPLQKVPEAGIKKSLERYFLKHTGKKPTDCNIVNGFGYLTFEDSAGTRVYKCALTILSNMILIMLADVKSIVANPPRVPFYAGTHLVLCTVPVSKVKASTVAEEEDPLVPNAGPFSPNSSITSSMYTRRNYGRDMSMESSASGSSIFNTSDPNFSLTRTGSRQRNSSSTSSSEVHFEVGGLMPRQDSGQLASLPTRMISNHPQGHSQEPPLFTMHEHAPTFG